MSNRTKLLVHTKRLPQLFSHAIKHGPDGSLEGKFAEEHLTFTHHLVSFFLAGSLAYLEGEDGSYSWNKPSPLHDDFDGFAASNPKPSNSYLQTLGISKSSMNAIVEVRNAVIHNNNDLSKNRSDEKHGQGHALKVVKEANLPGVTLNGSEVLLHEEFMQHVIYATRVVRLYYGEKYTKMYT